MMLGATNIRDIKGGKLRKNIIEAQSYRNGNLQPSAVLRYIVTEKFIRTAAPPHSYLFLYRAVSLNALDRCCAGTISQI